MRDPDEVLARLDDEQLLEAGDRSEVLLALAGSGALVRRTEQAFTDGFGSSGDPRLRAALDGRPRAAVVVTSEAGALLRAVLNGPGLLPPTVPVAVAERPPAWLAPLDLCIVVDPFGDRTSTAAHLEAAARCGARSVLVTPAGSRVAAVAGPQRAGLLGVPAAGGPAWTADLALLAAVLLVLGAADVAGPGPGTPGAPLAAMADRLDETAERCRVGSEAFVNPAKSVAAEVATALPAVAGEDAVGRAVAGDVARLLRAVAGLPAVLLTDRAEAGLFDGQHVPEERDIFRDRVDEVAAATLRLLLLSGGEGAPRPAEPSGLAEAAEARGVPVTRVQARPEGDPLVRLAEVSAVSRFAAAYAALGTGLDPGRHPDALVPAP